MFVVKLPGPWKKTAEILTRLRLELQVVETNDSLKQTLLGAFAHKALLKSLGCLDDNDKVKTNLLRAAGVWLQKLNCAEHPCSDLVQVVCNRFTNILAYGSMRARWNALVRHWMLLSKLQLSKIGQRDIERCSDRHSRDL